MDWLARLLRWIGENESVLSGIAAAIVIVGVLFTPLGVGLRAVLRRREGTRPEDGDEAAAGAAPTAASSPAGATGRPTLAVLPFATPSTADPALETFADGLGDDVINALSRCRHFLVIARNSSFVYKGRHVDVQAVARELGARYVVEGSVRALGDRVRVTVQLVDASTRAPAWSDRFDPPAASLADQQDEVAAHIAAAVAPAVRRAEAGRSRRRPAGELDAWSLVNRAWVDVQSALGDPGAARGAVEACEEALRRDPDDPFALAVLAHARSLLWSGGALAGDLEGVLGPARRAVALGGDDPAVQHCYAAVLGNVGRTADAVRAWERSLELDPHSAGARAGLGIALIYLRRPAEALESIDRAIRLSPRDPLVYHWIAHRALALAVLGRSAEAAEAARESVERSDTRVGWGASAMALADTGRLDEAREAWGRLVALTPGLEVGRVVDMLAAICPDEDSIGRAADALRRAAGA